MFPVKKVFKALEVSVESSRLFVSTRTDFANAMQCCNEGYPQKPFENTCRV